MPWPPNDWAERDLAWSRLIHHATAKPWLVWLLVGVSRLSDGAVWYAAMLALPWVGGPSGTACAIRMASVGLLNLVIYKTLKRHFARPRPYMRCASFRAGTPSLDEHSFPSGHTLHAVAFSLLLGVYYPRIAWLLWSFSGLVALSRIVLGLHYLSDVAIGALLGLATTWLVLLLF